MQFVSSQIIPDASNMATNRRCRKDGWANLINYLKELTKKKMKNLTITNINDRVARGLYIDDEPRDFSPKIDLRYLSHRREGDKMVDTTLDPFLTTSYFPLKLPSRLISVYSQNWTSFLFHVVKSRCALWTGGVWRLFKRFLKSTHLRMRTFKLSVARLPKTTHFLVVTRLVSPWPNNYTRFVKKLLNA